MKKTVLLDLGRLNDLCCGLGQVSHQLGKKLDGYDDGNIKINFLLPKDFSRLFKAESEPLSLRRRYLPFTCKKYDLWHAIHQDSAYFPSSRMTPYVLTIHDLNFLEEKSEGKARKRLQKLQKKVLRASALTVVSKFTKEVVRKNLNLSRGKEGDIPIFTVYQGIDFSVKNKKKINFPVSDKFLFAIGKIVEKKNFIALIDFIKLLPDYQLVIAGRKNSAYARRIEKKVEALGLRGRVILPGTVSEEEKKWLYYHCEAFVFPSKCEGFGMPVLEAMRFGKPVFLSTWSSLPEIGGDYAYYWKDFSPEIMKKVFLRKMTEFKNNPNLAKKLKEYAESFNWDRTVDAYLKIYKDILESTRDQRVDA
ncbi:MAG: glycosyltransferase family 4 protein [Waddliaceae bacterium]